MKKILSLVLCISMLISVFSMTTFAYTDEEIEKRIESVGEEYLKFYRQGDSDTEDGWGSFLGNLFSSTSGASGGGMSTISSLGDDADESAKGEVNYNEPLFEESVEDVYVSDAESYSRPYVPEPIPWDTEEYSSIEESGFIRVDSQPFSTFGADVDTASYSSLRRKLMEAYAWDEDKPDFWGMDDSAIRIEEMMNYFNYHYAEPEDGEKFGVTKNLVACPWNEDTLLLKVGIKAEDLEQEDNGSNIVFLVDTSGSMFSFDKLPLVQKALGILTEQLNDDDVVSIVTYAGSEEVALEGVSGNDKKKIMRAIDRLEADGSTYGEGGINKAYEIAEKYFIEGGNNRVVLCTDGDFNVGVTSEAGLEDLISKKRETGVFFSCLGFGDGNYSDTTMETLADNGNGNYFYIDCEREARRALEEEFMSTIYTVAKDTKFQVEFNKETVKGYRLIGYENRQMAAEDFNNDKKDGGEVGAGQTVTVLYEVVPFWSDYELPTVTSHFDNEEETEAVEETADGNADYSLACVSIRYKEPDADESELREYYVTTKDMQDEIDEDTSWAAGVAQAGMFMRDSEYMGTTTLDGIYDRLKNDSEIMDNDYKAEFLYMLRVMKKYKEYKDEVEEEYGRNYDDYEDYEDYEDYDDEYWDVDEFGDVDETEEYDFVVE